MSEHVDETVGQADQTSEHGGQVDERLVGQVADAVERHSVVDAPREEIERRADEALAPLVDGQVQAFVPLLAEREVVEGIVQQSSAGEAAGTDDAGVADDIAAADESASASGSAGAGGSAVAGESPGESPADEKSAGESADAGLSVAAEDAPISGDFVTDDLTRDDEDPARQS